MWNDRPPSHGVRHERGAPGDEPQRPVVGHPERGDGFLGDSDVGDAAVEDGDAHRRRHDGAGDACGEGIEGGFLTARADRTHQSAGGVQRGDQVLGFRDGAPAKETGWGAGAAASHSNTARSVPCGDLHGRLGARRGWRHRGSAEVPFAPSGCGHLQLEKPISISIIEENSIKRAKKIYFYNYNADIDWTFQSEIVGRGFR